MYNAMKKNLKCTHIYYKYFRVYFLFFCWALRCLEFGKVFFQKMCFICAIAPLPRQV